MGRCKMQNEDWIGSGSKYNKYNNKYYQEIVLEFLFGWLGLSLILICSQQSNIENHTKPI